MQADGHHNHYQTLEVSPWANERQIRRAYRVLSKRYHPDTSTLPPAIAIEKFRAVNEAYATLSNPERRAAYDQKIQFTRVSTIRPSSAATVLQYDDGLPSERPLSGGELFALLTMLLTLVGCLALAIGVALLRGDRLLLDLAIIGGLR